MRSFGLVMLGVLIGIGFTQLYARRIKGPPMPTDLVTLPRAELKQLVRAAVLVDDDSKGSRLRYESESGSVALECPTADACNLEVPARPRALANAQSIVRPALAPLSQLGSVEAAAPPQPGDIVISSGDQTRSVHPTETADAQDSIQRTSAQSQTIYDQMGIQAGDMIESINQRPIASAMDAFQMLSAATPDTIWEIIVRRSGREVKLSPGGTRPARRHHSG